MPALDKTGPQRQGPMTGRGLGCCRRGFPMRCCGCCGCNALQTKEDKINSVKAYKKVLEEEIEEVDKELADLQK